MENNRRGWRLEYTLDERMKENVEDREGGGDNVENDKDIEGGRENIL